ncbi:MAG: DoxX family membrane protein [Myxococcota bacterium]|nr:DoxX family membrane protein [Myxococcota bacterium]MDW8362612.1 MauE/DoxX family redox-associated membrane protein [Myxococcales bacterium]
MSALSLRSLGVLAARLVLAAIFATAAVPKLVQPDAFAAALDNYHLLPAALVGPVAVAVPVVELVLAASLLTGVDARGAAVVAAGLLVVFGVAMASALVRGIDVECGCFGGRVAARVGVWPIVRNAGLVVLAVLVALSPPVSWREPWRALRRGIGSRRISSSSPGPS